MSRPRMRRWSIGLDAATETALRVRAKAHRVSMAAYARAAIVGVRPGGAPGQVAYAADGWWDRLSPSRRAQVYGWLTKNPLAAEPFPGEMELPLGDADGRD